MKSNAPILNRGVWIPVSVCGQGEGRVDLYLSLLCNLDFPRNLRPLLLLNPASFRHFLLKRGF